MSKNVNLCHSATNRESEEVEKQIQNILDFVRSDYPKSATQEEHEHNMEVVAYAVNQCKFGLKEKLRQALTQATRNRDREVLEWVTRQNPNNYGRSAEEAWGAGYFKNALVNFLTKNNNDL